MEPLQMQNSSLPWWRTDSYDGELAIPGQFDHHWAGPRGVALVRAWPDGRTDQGWGLNPPKGSTDGFMPRYHRGEFNARRVMFGYEQGKWTFAWVMRSMRLVCIDIDGKNDGFKGAGRLGMLPPTMSEISKSGNGYHLFYLVDDEWDDDAGYAVLSDRIGIEQGVDFRGTGCVYHHPQQRWNSRPAALLPDQVFQRVKSRDLKIAATNARIQTVLATNDDLEVLMMHDEITQKLARPIAAGKRNNTLFAIGSEMKQAGVPQWETLLADRAVEIGLPDDEVVKLVANINRYALAGTA